MKQEIQHLVECAHKGDAPEPVTLAILQAIADKLPKEQTEDHCKECKAATKGYNAALEDVKSALGLEERKN